MEQLHKLQATIFQNAPTAPDGRTDAEAAATPSVNQTSLLHDLTHLGRDNAATMVQAFKTVVSGQPLNDKELLLEHGVHMLQSLPPNSRLGADAAGQFIKMLWDDLPHPPGTLAGPTTRYRRHDGGNNNLWDPELGKAGSPYSRSVPPMKPKGPNLPDVELVFEYLLRRKEGEFRKHPSGLNRLFFSFATVVIHECFQTSRDNKWVNETSSYVDLSTLYGNTSNEQKRVRTYKNGLIYPDSIASERIMLMPPGVIAVLMMFSRNHNHIAETLLSINEQGTYGSWDKLTEAQQKEQDEDIFQLSRNINVGFFASVVLRDYVAAILNTPRANSEWSLNLGEEIRSAQGGRVERGLGNAVSVEFAVLYHWHAALSAADAKWMEEVISSSLPQIKSIDEMTPGLFWQMTSKITKDLMSKPASEWTFGGLERGPDGSFDDADLGRLIKDCIEEPAHAFGANGTPASLKVVDLMGQLQAREIFNTCTLNEFRRYLNLTAYKSFSEWNDDPAVSRAAELLYGHIDNLELYPGLQAECTKPPMPGSGVCPGQTTGRGILDDAVALVRGDRFLTYDFNSNTLTNWGVSKLADLPGGAYGGILAKLIFNGLPGEFTGTSTYALMPFYTPEAVQGILEGNKVVAKYDLRRPPPNVMKLVGIHTQEGVKKAFEDRETFHVMYQAAIRNCTDGHEFMIGWDDQARHDPRSVILHKVFFEENFEQNLTKFFRETVRSLIRKSTLNYPDHRRSIDIVRDVCNVTPIMWLARRFAIPIKDAAHPRGLVTIPELFDIYLVLFMYQSFNILPVNEWKLRETAETVAPILRQIFAAHLRTQRGLTEYIVDWLAKGSAYEVGPDADQFYHALNKTGLDLGDIVGDCIGMSAPVAGNITQQASLLIDLYLSEGYEQYKARIVELAQKDDEASDKELLGFVFEGMRHAGVVPGLPRVASKDVTFEDGARGSLHIKAGQYVLIATSSAAMDPVAFPDPEKIDPHRPMSSYTLLGHGMHYCFGARLIGPALVATLKEVFRLKNLRRAEGKLGRFSVIEQDIAGVKAKIYLDANAKESPIPTTLHLLYDE
ncbi:uncharacterized protein Z520_04545 [Fonsecaea multimorphosa CBS 102226]|uniref:Linoleate 8R-lipoxygenase n=1 Tax=Fonsecaea multimorphosa CBS 102226 TaxID=1442371 RepID=A0A0D2KT76_9EURO|nr:uncharacterized protein Z520_04545 [Fonsecaea multimorphosa CBS 102226]KIX99908.1 hypothetical protein Z520_04545 [Fonsecaea multimorphosa CBS 102226]OAL26383.1 hypothetical protein AYO22_04301 [Fonsecaea multimorphosa]